MEVRGRVEHDDEVIHVIAHHMTDATDRLHALSDDLLQPETARADHVNNPIHGRRDISPRKDLVAGHPRNARIIPKSRDFH